MGVSADEGLSNEDLLYEIFRARMDPSIMLPVHKKLTDKKLWAKMSPEGRKGIVKWGAS